ncbi:MAG: 30S ribosomal protein S17 [Planctomycetaceae bacterium]|nr:30S ribosomal protein S17 [Planctomycetaceae bacterium]
MRKTLIGVVTSDKRSKTRRVEVSRLYQHATYGKIVRGRTVCQVHDENNETHTGDTVEIAECRPRSATKRWELVRVVKASTDVDRQARRMAEEEAQPAGEGAAE